MMLGLLPRLGFKLAATMPVKYKYQSDALLGRLRQEQLDLAALAASAASAAPAASACPVQIEQTQLVQEELDAQDRVRAVQEQQVWSLNKYGCWEVWDPPWVAAGAVHSADYMRRRYPEAMAMAVSVAAEARASTSTKMDSQLAWNQQRVQPAWQGQEQMLLKHLL